MSIYAHELKEDFEQVMVAWLFEKPEGFTNIWNRFDLKAPLPLTRGRKPSYDSVEKHYLSLL